MTVSYATIGATVDFVNQYQYDGLGRLTRLTQTEAFVGTHNDVAPKRVDFAYNLASQFEAIARYADLAGTELVVESIFQYDGRGRLTEIDHDGIVTHGYAYDAADRLTDYTNSAYSAESATYQYDDRGQLEIVDRTVLDESYAYDENGNRDTANGSTYATGLNNRLTFDGTYTYIYDDEGNRTARFL